MRILAPPPRTQVEPLAEPPKLSIVIATYEAADTVAAAVRSALEQTLPAHEVIVVDDGSRDDVAGALCDYRDRIELVRKENGGGASALNAGAGVASGDFLAILDADDAYDPRRVEALAEIAGKRPDLDLITTDAAFMVDGEQVGRFSDYTPFVTEGQRTAIFQSCFAGGWPAIRLDSLRAAGGFDESLRTGYDWECWARLILGGSQAGMVDEPFYLYRLHSGTLTSSRASSLWDRVTLLEKCEDAPSLSGDEQAALRRALRLHRSRAVEAEAQDALYGTAPRANLLRRALLPGIQARARAVALATVLAPPLARRVVPEYYPAEERLGAEEPAG
ncbi:MAG TPA: glycosyltransferase [Solirubrobacterales bacterium]|nr:glycosyltransferase [Solirubrobacterales bacterium]